MHGAANVVKRLSLAPLADDHVGLVKRLVPVEWHRQQRELVLVLHVRIVTDPRRVELPGKQQSCDLLIGPPLYELNGSAELLCKVRLEQRQQLDIGIEKERIEADANRLGRARWARRPKQSRREKANEHVPTTDQRLLLATQ